MKFCSSLFFLSLTLSVIVSDVAGTLKEESKAIQVEEKEPQVHSFLRHEEDHLDNEDEIPEASYKTLMGPSLSSSSSRTRGGTKLSRRVGRDLKPRSCKSSKSDSSSCDDDDDDDTPATTFIIVIPGGSPTPSPTFPDPTIRDNFRIIFNNIDGFECNQPLFLQTNRNPFNGFQPRLISKNNGQSRYCNVRMLEDVPRNEATSAFARFGFSTNRNEDLRFQMEVGYRLYGPQNGNAEGMTIVIHQDNNGVSAIGGTGSDLGVYGGITNALVIELDTEEQSSQLDNGQDNVHVMLVGNGRRQELGETSGLQVRTLNDGNEEGRIWLEYNCKSQDNTLRIYLDNVFTSGEGKPISPVLAISNLDLSGFFDMNRDFFAGFTASSNSQQSDNADITSWLFQDCSAPDGGNLPDPPDGVLVDFGQGFICPSRQPFFMERNSAPSSAFGGQYPALIQKNSFDPNSLCYLRMTPDTPSQFATSAFRDFAMSATNTNMRFSMEVGYRLFGSNSGHAEGMAVVIHQDRRVGYGTNAIGGSGGFLGVYNGIRNALVIEWDTEQQTSLFDNGEDNIHVMLIDGNGRIQEVAETSGIPIRTDNSGFSEGRLWIDYNCASDNIMSIYLDDVFQAGDRKPIFASSAVLRFSIDLSNFFVDNGRFFTAGFTAASNFQMADNADITSWRFNERCGLRDDTQPLPPSPTPAPTPGPIGNILCVANGIQQLSVGARSNPNGQFVNVNSQQSLRNAIDCLRAFDTETHTQQSHVWWAPQPLELVFDLTSQFTIREVLFWNYYEEFYSVDRIDFTFIASNGNSVAYTYFPRNGVNPSGSQGNPIAAERWTLPSPTSASRVLAYMTSDNGNQDLDFQNIVFVT